MTKSMNGEQLCARFAYKPHKLGRCSTGGDKNLLYKCISEDHCVGYRKRISQFSTLYSYLLFISKKVSRDILDKNVVEAYWLGNNLLQSFSNDDFDSWIDIYTDIAGKSHLKTLFKKSFIKLSLPFIPIHCFQVLFSSFLSGNINEEFIEKVNNCSVRGGKIINVSKNEVMLKSWSFNIHKGSVKIVPKEEHIHYIKAFFPKLHNGDILSFHWKEACTLLSVKQNNNLLIYTKKLLSNL